MLHHNATILVCYGGHFEFKMTAKIQKSSDFGEIWHYYRHDRVQNWALIIFCYVLTLFFIHTTSTCIVRLGDIYNALRYSNQYFICVLGISNLHISSIFLLNARTVSTVWYIFFHFIISYEKNQLSCNC
jgi:hypothetical protein